jgi:ABC-type multidrug transport system ATPase subunit
MSEAMIDVVNVTHHYGVRPVLRDVSLTINRGELLALMGPNGMGKSTLMGVMAGVLWPVGGYVTINGLRRRVDEATELSIRQQVVYLPADPWVPTSMTGREWVLATGRVYGVGDQRLLSHAERLLEVFNLLDQAGGTIGRYSSGQRKKIALCAALASDAPVMLLDEPFAGGLDPSGILSLKSILQRHTKARDRTVVMATPVPEVVEEVADRVALIDDGRLTIVATPAELRQQSGAASLADAYEHLVNPDTLAKLDRYFAGEAAK